MLPPFFVILGNGKLLITPNHAYIGPNKIDLSASIPSGVIAMWSGSSSNIPSGWLLCNGSNGTPDLRNRFIVGAGSSYSVGKTGGSNTVTLTIDQMPSHSHSYRLVAEKNGNHSHSLSDVATPSRIPYNYHSSTMDGGAQSSDSTHTDVGGAHTHSISGSISSAGSGQSHENRPPYYALCFIMKI